MAWKSIIRVIIINYITQSLLRHAFVMIFFIGHASINWRFCELFYPFINWCSQIWRFPRLNNLSFWFITASINVIKH